MRRAFVSNPSENPYGFVILLELVFQCIVRSLYERLALEGYDDIRLTHGYVLYRLNFSGATITELAKLLGMTKQGASQLIDHLEQHNYVTRQPHPSDRRGKIVILTDRGRTCLHAMETIFIQQEKNWTEQLGTTHMFDLRSNLSRLVNILNDGKPPEHLLFELTPHLDTF
jgi:DNA-binding MarR family transcriptional regulator